MAYKVVFLASEGGGNFKKAVEQSSSHKYEVTKLIVNKECGAVEKAQALNVPYEIISLKGKALFEAIDSTIPQDTDLIVLGGFMPIVPEWFCNKWTRKIINIHPSLLPAYGGKGMYGVHVQEAVMEAKEEYAGCTVHYVEAGVDTGEIIEQWKIKVDYSLTPWELGGEIFFRGSEMLPFVIEKVCDLQIVDNQEIAPSAKKDTTNDTHTIT